MDETSTNPDEELATGEPETPEDVAVLYTWANVHGGKYRDFSASRREFRAEQRHRLVEAQRQAELEAARTKEEAAAVDLAKARRVEEDTAADVTVDSATKAEAEETLRRAEEHAEQERQAAQRHVETAEDLKRAMEQAQREVEEARQRADEQAARWREADARWRAMNGDQQVVPGETNDPYYYAGPLEPTAFAPGKGVRSSVPQRLSSGPRIAESYQRNREGRRAGDSQPAGSGEGLLSDRRRPGSSGIPPASGERRVPQQLVEPRIETLEDTRERLRQGERSRRENPFAGDEGHYDNRIDDSYYDRDPGRGTQPAGSRGDGEFGTAPSDLHIRPRSARTRATDYASVADTGESSDPTPSSTYSFQPAKPRRRDSAVDVAARTTRHPRDPDQQSAGGGRRPIEGDRRPTADAERRTGGPSVHSNRPEWLASNDESDAAGYARQHEEDFTETAASPDRRGNQFVRASDGGANLRPLTEAPSEANPDTAEPAERRRFPRSGRGRSELRYESAAPEAPTEAQRAPESSRSTPEEDRESPSTISALRSTAPADTLQQSRERVASRWFALKGLVAEGSEGAEQAPADRNADRNKELRTPMIAIVSLAGGVGKTSMVATIGRSLSSAGEKVLLAETTSYGLLPYYFGARALRPDVVRTFSPPPGSTDAPVYMVNYETEMLIADDVAQARVAEQVLRHARGTQRVLLDINASSAWLARLLARQGARILVPVSPDMTSVIGIQAVERSFAGITDGEGKPVAPCYVLNQFDASLPLHLDVREVLRKQLGDRLLTIVIRRSPAVSEALAEGMTVMDYAPDSPITEDYKHLADWVRNLAAPATVGLRSIRWSER